jgi:hypothetical protein
MSALGAPLPAHEGIDALIPNKDWLGFAVVIHRLALAFGASHQPNILGSGISFN